MPADGAPRRKRASERLVHKILRLYHDVHRSRGQYYQLQRSGAAERTVRDIDIFEAKTIPPTLGRQTEHRA